MRCGVAELNGKDFRALTRISSRDNTTVAEIGETCERVDPSALGWLLQGKSIERIEPAAVVTKTKGKA